MNLLGAAVWTIVLNVGHAVGEYSYLPLAEMRKKSCAAAVDWAFPTTYILHEGNRRHIAEATVDQETIPFDGKLDPSKEVVFLVHGFLHGCKHRFANSTAEEYLRHVPGVQVVNVCWSASMTAAVKPIGLLGAVFFRSAVSIIRCVGYSVARFLKRVKKEVGLPWKKMTMVSHSLGTYLAGYAGTELKGKIGKQIGIDPASRTFTWARTPFRRGSGRQVIVLHTSLFGDFHDRGTVDFYANNGFQQPACGIAGTLHSNDHDDPIMCSHQISFSYFNIALSNPKAFPATQCQNYRQFASHSCDDNPKTYFSPYTNATGRYYFPTTDKPPYFGPKKDISRTMKSQMSKLWNRAA